MIETAATVTTREERSNLAHPGYSGAKNWLNSSMSGHCCVQCKVSQLSWKAKLVEKRHLFHIARESRMFLACHTISSRNTYTAAGTVEKEFLVSTNVYLYFILAKNLVLPNCKADKNFSSRPTQSTLSTILW